MITSVHLADVGIGAALKVLARPPKPAAVDGLRQANVAVAAPLGGSALPSPMPGRVGLVAFWDDGAALDRFLAEHPLAERLAGGWHARLEPLRAYGTWPGLPDDIERSRSTDHDGPAIVLTLGRLRLTQTIRFFRTSRKAETRAVVAPGMVWATGLARPPFFATCSLWSSTRELATYAYGRSEPAHHDAIEADRAKPFHHREAFIRFRPIATAGRLDGRNPLPEHALAG